MFTFYTIASLLTACHVDSCFWLGPKSGFAFYPTPDRVEACVINDGEVGQWIIIVVNKDEIRISGGPDVHPCPVKPCDEDCKAPAVS
jgi:hypothetical protein